MTVLRRRGRQSAWRWTSRAVVGAVMGVLALAAAPASAAAAAQSEPPAPPTNLRVVDVTPFSVFFEWDPSPTDGVAIYSVFDATQDVGHSFYHAETSGAVSHLQPGTTYTFHATAYKRWKTSAPSNSVTVTTDEIDPLPVPASLRVVENETGTEMTVAFDIADDPRVEGYRLEYVNGSTHVHNTRLTTTLGDTPQSITVTDLSPETDYTFTVTARMSASARDDYTKFSGEPSEPLTATSAPDSVAPTSPETLTILDRTGTSVSLDWGSHARDEAGVTDYVISNGETTQTVPASGGSEGTFTGLQPETSYTFTVRARDAAGNLSEPTEARTIATGVHPDTEAPAPVTGLEGRTLHGYGNFVNWEPSTDNVTLQRALTYRLTTDGGDDITLVGRTGYDGFPILAGNRPLNGCTVTVVVIDGVGNQSEPRSTKFC